MPAAQMKSDALSPNPIREYTRVIRLSDHEAAMADTEPKGSYQRGYDEGRHQGTKHRVADIERLREDRDSHQRLCIDQMLINDELLGLLRELMSEAVDDVYEVTDPDGLIERVNNALAKHGEQT